MVAKMLPLSSIRELVIKHGLNRTYWVGYSGGMDSHVLLALCHELRRSLPIELHAIHVNHQINPNAQAWAQHCRQVCAEWNVPYYEFNVKINLGAGQSLEDMARTLRYEQIAQCMQAGDVLLTAHHQEDQAETMLLQLMRGAGLKGLSAMPVEKEFGDGWHVRPLLNIPQSDLIQYAQQQQLNWITDDSNHNTQFKRNFLRHVIFPALTQHWPSAAKTMARSAANCAEAQALLQEFATELHASVLGSRADTVSVSKLLQLTSEKQRLVLRHWIVKSGYMLPDSDKMQTIQSSVLTAEWDRLPHVVWGTTELRRYRDDLYLMPTLALHDEQAIYPWDFSRTIALPGIGHLQAEMKQGTGLSKTISEVSVRFRQGGEMANLGKRGRHTLKNLFNEWQVLPWERERIPLLFAAEKLIAVVGYCVDPDYVAQEDEVGVEVLLRRS